MDHNKEVGKMENPEEKPGQPIAGTRCPNALHCATVKGLSTGVLSGTAKTEVASQITGSIKAKYGAKTKGEFSEGSIHIHLNLPKKKIPKFKKDLEAGKLKGLMEEAFLSEKVKESVGNDVKMTVNIESAKVKMNGTEMDLADVGREDTDNKANNKTETEKTEKTEKSCMLYIGEFSSEKNKTTPGKNRSMMNTPFRDILNCFGANPRCIALVLLVIGIILGIACLCIAILGPTETVYFVRKIEVDTVSDQSHESRPNGDQTHPSTGAIEKHDNRPKWIGPHLAVTLMLYKAQNISSKNSRSTTVPTVLQLITEKMKNKTPKRHYGNKEFRPTTPSSTTHKIAI